MIGMPLTVYGGGGQQRGCIALEDSVRCLQLLLHNPPEPGEYRVVNQLDEVYRLDELATRIVEAGCRHRLTAGFRRIPNPRLESEDHSYDVTSEILPSLGYRSRNAMDEDLDAIFRKLMSNAERLGLLEGVLIPDVNWVGGRQAARRPSGR